MRLVMLQIPNEFLNFRSTATEIRHPIRLYSRYINKVYFCPVVLDLVLRQPGAPIFEPCRGPQLLFVADLYTL